MSEAARAGSVPAMRLYWEILRADAEPDDKTKGDSLIELDELAARRRHANIGGAG